MDSSCDEDGFPALEDLLQCLPLVKGDNVDGLKTNPMASKLFRAYSNDSPDIVESKDLSKKEKAPSISQVTDSSLSHVQNTFAKSDENAEDSSDSSVSFISARDDFCSIEDSPHDESSSTKTSLNKPFGIHINTLVLSSTPPSENSDRQPAASSVLRSRISQNSNAHKTSSKAAYPNPAQSLCSTTSPFNEDSDDDGLPIYSTRRIKSPRKIVLSDSEDDSSEAVSREPAGTIILSPQLSDDENAILTYSPPHRRKQSPTKLQHVPLVPEPPVTPRSRRGRIPRSPFRESNALFWNEQQNSAWIDRHVILPDTPRTPLTALEHNANEASTRRSPKKSKAELEAIRAKKHFMTVRTELATNLLSSFVEAIYPDLPTLLKGPIEVLWSKTLSTTAGRATYSKSKNMAHIELSCKVIDNEDRLRSTLSHELCHILVWVVDGQFANPHGREFKRYGTQFQKILGIRIETTHAYEIDYKYQWQCTQCAKIYGRHSKSIDPSKSVCSACHAVLRQIRPVPRAVTARSPIKGDTTGLARYRAYATANMDRIKREHPGLPYGERVKLVAAEYAAQKTAATVTTTTDLTSALANLSVV